MFSPSFVVLSTHCAVCTTQPSSPDGFENPITRALHQLHSGSKAEAAEDANVEKRGFATTRIDGKLKLVGLNPPSL